MINGCIPNSLFTVCHPSSSINWHLNRFGQNALKMHWSIFSFILNLDTNIPYGFKISERLLRFHYFSAIKINKSEILWLSGSKLTELCQTEAHQWCHSVKQQHWQLADTLNSCGLIRFFNLLEDYSQKSNQCQGLPGFIPNLELGCRCTVGLLVKGCKWAVHMPGAEEGEWKGGVLGVRAAGCCTGSRCSDGAGGGEGRSSYLWGSKEGRRGIREGSYKALGAHKIRHFQLHRVR